SPVASYNFSIDVMINPWVYSHLGFSLKSSVQPSGFRLISESAIQVEYVTAVESVSGVCPAFLSALQPCRIRDAPSKKYMGYCFKVVFIRFLFQLNLNLHLL